ncbi:MAG: ABC transporter permease [Calditrichia bacterium]
MQKYSKNRSFIFGAALLCLMLFGAIAAPLISSFDPNVQTTPSVTRFQSPSAEHWFGADKFGRDVFSRVLHGGRISLFIAAVVVIGAVVIGGSYGAVAGYFGGWVDALFMRIVDALLAFPVIFLTVTCMALFGSGLFWLVAVLIFTGWMDIARLVRAEVHALKQQPFVIRAHASGIPAVSVIFRHLLPNVLKTLQAAIILRTADIIVIESALSFLGLGVQPPTASWGGIMSDGMSALGDAWWLSVFPGMAIFATTLGLNLVGEGMKRA